MNELARKINLAPELIEKIQSENIVKVENTALKCLKKGFKVLKKEDDLMRLAVILYLAVRVKEKYKSAGIDDKIYFDTMSDIRIWCEKNNNHGLKNYSWLKNHVSFQLFRLGRLQFQIYECNNSTLLYNKLPFAYGEKLIYIHIPEGEKLERTKCIESLKLANIFFSRYFSSYIYKLYFCESWLLFEANRDFMAQDSNIVQFLSLFDVHYNLKIDAQAIERIFGKRCILKKNYPENTDLQKRAKKYIREGNRLGIGIGTINKNTVN